ncbi:MAG: hypothetical protein ACJAYS_001167 [Lentimonas sp.]|jgi:hypothetical protein
MIIIRSAPFGMIESYRSRVFGSGIGPEWWTSLRMCRAIEPSTEFKAFAKALALSFV